MVYIQRDDVYRHFRFTRRNTPKVVFWGLLIPIGAIYLASVEDVRERCCLMLLSVSDIVTHAG
jgi:hypothetical protein